MAIPSKQQQKDWNHMRRQDDTRIRSIEEQVNHIRVKLENGITSRSHEALAKIGILQNDVKDMNLEMVEHITEANKYSSDIRQIKESMKSVENSQLEWIKLFNRTLLIVVVGLCSLGATIFINIDHIDKISDHIAVVIEHNNPEPNKEQQ